MRRACLAWWTRSFAGASEQALLRRTAMRLGAQVALTVVGIVLLLAGVSMIVLVEGQHSIDDRVMTAAVVRAYDVADAPPAVWLVVDSPTGREITPGLPKGLPYTPALAQVAQTGVTRTDSVHTASTEFRVRTQRRGTAVVQAAMDLTIQHRERAELLRAMLLSGGLALILAVIAGVGYGLRAVKPLAAAGALQRRFVADASHELRTPLTLLSTRAQLLRRSLRRESLAPEVQSDIDGLVSDAAQLTAILDDLLLAADPRVDQPAHDVDLAGLVEQVVAAAAAQAERQGVSIIQQSDPGPVPVRATAGGVRRALTALVDNAIRHACSRVTVTVIHRGSYAVAVVADDGAGIDPPVLSRMFERFASTATPVDGRYRHYGLGLALVAELAHRYGGRVTAHGSAGGGAELHLFLPAAAKKAPALDTGPKRRWRTLF